MKESNLHKIWVLILACLVLVSTSSFTLNQRFCEGELLISSLLTELQHCKHTSCSAELAHTSHPTKHYSKNCCEETTQLFKGQERLTQKENSQKNNFKKKLSSFSMAVFMPFLELNFQQDQNVFCYSPPIILDNQLQLHYQVFLI